MAAPAPGSQTGPVQNTFVGEIAERYDADCADISTEQHLEPALRLLAELAGDGPALEFAIGTGRVGLPLSRRIPVTGLEISQDMVDQLRGKPGGAELPVTIGDMARTRVPGEFSLVYLVFNTISNLLEQDEQVACFANAAAHLRPGGAFLIEMMLPDLRLLPPGQRLVPFDVSPHHLGFDSYDLVNQRLTSHHYRIGEAGTGYSPSHHRYAWPAEYDLMARMAGMTLAGRWSGWDREPLTGDSRSHISVWRT